MLSYHLTSELLGHQATHEKLQELKKADIHNHLLAAKDMHDMHVRYEHLLRAPTKWTQGTHHTHSLGNFPPRAHLQGVDEEGLHPFKNRVAASHTEGL